MTQGKWPHLPRAPVHEAVFDFRVQLPEDVDHRKLLGLHAQFEKDYPIREERRGFRGQIEIRGGRPVGTAARDLGVHGYFFKNPAGTQIAQFKLDGFTFSRLQPYEHWEPFRAEAERLWNIYKQLSPTVSRAAVRYINHLDLPVPVNDLADYLKLPPKWPDLYNLQASAFLSRVEVSDPTSQLQAILTQALLPPKGPSVITVLVDIDVFKEIHFGQDYAAAWKSIDEFQDVKNNLFFEMITKRSQELCQ